MPRIDSVTYRFTLIGGAINLVASHPATHPRVLVYDDAALTALLTAPQKAGIVNVLNAMFARMEQDAKALKDAERAALNTDP